MRIIQFCKKMGIASVAVFSEIDTRSLHVRLADEAVFLGPSRSDQSYLVKEKLIQATLDTGCQAVHPGYGFLSENPGFAEAVAKAGLTFVGPPAVLIATLGDKIASKELAVAAGVPVWYRATTVPCATWRRLPPWPVASAIPCCSSCRPAAARACAWSYGAEELAGLFRAC